MTSRALISLGDDRIAQLDRIAKARGLSRAAVIRRARQAASSTKVCVSPTIKHTVMPRSMQRSEYGRTAMTSALRRERPRLKLADAVILASAQVHDRVLVTRNTKDFPADMPGIRVPYTL